jgi:chaperonin cofactor prefoldin
MNKKFDFKSIESILFQNAYLTYEDYLVLTEQKLKIPGIYYFLKFYIIEILPTERFPDKFQNLIVILNSASKAEKILNESYNYPDKSEFISLNEIIVKYGKIPRNIVNFDNRNVYELIEGYELKKIIYRFFQNKGKVFSIEKSRKIYDKLEINISSYLLDKGILRRGLSEDLPKVLNHKTKDELIEIIEENKIKHDLGNKLYSSSKRNIIKSIEDNKLISQINYQEYFYFLNFYFQELKEWIVKEELFFKVFCFFHDEVENIFIGADTLVKELIKIKE